MIPIICIGSPRRLGRTQPNTCVLAKFVSVRNALVLRFLVIFHTGAKLHYDSDVSVVCF